MFAPYWIQSSDYSHQDYPAADAPAIERALMTHDWRGEAERQASLSANGGDECDAGLGIVGSDDRQLLIRPNGEGRCAVDYSFFDREKAFGFLPKRNYHAGELENVPLETAARLIAPFLANDYAAVKSEIEALK